MEDLDGKIQGPTALFHASQCIYMRDNSVE